MENNIIILPEDLVDKIAAGEVVERPASVVKELVENSIDAGAQNISVEIKQGGIKFIRVTDDGSGMDEKNSELAFLRHATSKIKSVDDLYRIQTLGFRGEALSSVASVSLLDMLTRTQESLSGIRVKIEGGMIKDKREAGAPVGTSVIVREIFYNIPARRKFLKSILTETRHVIDLLTKFAIAYPEISFKLISEGRELFDFRACVQTEKLPHPLSPPLHIVERGTGGEVLPQPQHGDLRQRVADIFGNNQMEKMVEIKTETETETKTESGHKKIYIGGFLGKAEIARSNRAELYLFVNRRPIVSRSLYHAVQSGYGELLPKGKFPFAIIFIEIDAGLVDVNVHPTKSEVRFSDEKGVHDLVYMKVKGSLTSPQVIPALRTIGTDKADSQAINGKPPLTPTLSPEGRGGEEKTTLSEPPITETEKERIQESFFRGELVKHEYEPPKRESVRKEEMESKGSLQVEPSKTDSSPAVGGIGMTGVDSVGGLRTGVLTPREGGNLWQLADTYILSQVKGNLMVLDQHAAHERILYEEAMRNLTQKPASSQQILFPTVLDLSPKEFQTFEASKELIQRLGFEIKSFGGRSILVTAVPSAVKNRSGELFLKEILAELEEEEKVEKDRVKAVAKSFACHAAVKAGDKLTQEEMSSLVHQLFATEEPYSCPHGRPTVVKISIEELNKKFGRS